MKLELRDEPFVCLFVFFCVFFFFWGGGVQGDLVQARPFLSLCTSKLFLGICVCIFFSVTV